MRPGTIGGGGGGDGFNPATGYGHFGHTHWEDETVVHESRPFFEGHEIGVTERLRFTDDQKGVHYVHEIHGWKGAIRHEVVINV